MFILCSCRWNVLMQATFAWIHFSFFFFLLFLNSFFSFFCFTGSDMWSRDFSEIKVQSWKKFWGRKYLLEKTAERRFFFCSTSHFRIFSCCYTWCFQSRSRGVSYCFGLVLIILHICSSQTESTNVNACRKGKRGVVYKYLRCILCLLLAGKLFQDSPYFLLS